MRRSTTITLTLLAGAGLGLAYCSNNDPDTEGVLESQAACVERLGSDAATECADVFEAARLNHAATAPRFDSPEACRTATGTECTPLNAEPRPAGAPWASTAASIFIPAMAGVMIGRALSDGTRGATPVYAGAAPPPCPPGMPGPPGCLPASSSSSTSSSTSSSSSASGRRYWYSGNSYAGSSDGDGRAGFRRASTSSQGDGLLMRSSRTGSTASRAGASGSRSGGLGFSAAAHSGGGS